MERKPTQSDLLEINQTLTAQALEHSRALEEAQALTHLGSWAWDIATNVVTWSDELYRIYGLKPQERQIDFDNFLVMIHPDDREMIKNTIFTSYNNGKPFSFDHRIVLPDGKIRELHGIGKTVRNKKGEAVRMIGTSQDMTGHRAAERALELSDQRFKAITIATHDLIYDLDLSNGKVWFNDVLKSVYGYDNLTTNTTLIWWLSLMHPSEVDSLKDQYHTMLKSTEQTYSIECQIRKADGSYGIIKNRAYILRNDTGKPIRIMGSCQDITQQRQLDRAKDEFISLVSHQLRTPLTVIRLYGNMLSDGIVGPLSKQQSSYVRKMTNASIRLIKLVGDILNISRIELNRIKLDCSPHDPNFLIRSVLEELTPVIKEKSATVVFTPMPKLTNVPLDATLFSEIVHNLVGNALRYGRPTNSEVGVSFIKNRRGYQLRVYDNGQGIPKSDQPHIFERFYRAHNAATVDSNGSGLGLYMVKLFCEAASGTVHFDSVEGKGTTFYVDFPPAGMQPATASSITTEVTPEKR